MYERRKKPVTLQIPSNWRSITRLSEKQNNLIEQYCKDFAENMKKEGINPESRFGTQLMGYIRMSITNKYRLDAFLNLLEAKET